MFSAKPKEVLFLDAVCQCVRLAYCFEDLMAYRHRHIETPGKNRHFPWTQCVASPEKGCTGESHGCVIYVDECRCGALRFTEANGLHVTVGPWGQNQAEQDEQDLLNGIIYARRRVQLRKIQRERRYQMMLKKYDGLTLEEDGFSLVVNNSGTITAQGPWWIWPSRFDTKVTQLLKKYPEFLFRVAELRQAFLARLGNLGS
jgi:hypothetical protein